MKGAMLHGVINSKEVSIYVTQRAMTFLEKSNDPLYVGMELYFTYFMQKKMVFSSKDPGYESTKITDNLYMYFLPLQSRRGKMKDMKDDRSDLMVFPVSREGALVPSYVKIDRISNKWQGDFTWKTGSRHLKPVYLNFN